MQLFNESGYLEEPSLVTKDRILNHLADHPDLVKDWENYSSNKRYSPGWYFLKDKSGWVVGYSGTPSQGQKKIFTSDVEACAEFILHELKVWAEHTLRR
jgi:hypothetical protein